MNPDLEELKARAVSHSLRPSRSVLHLIGRLGAVQVDPVAIVAPNHEIVLATRLHRNPAKQLSALYRSGQVLETYAKERCIVSADDRALFWPLIRARRRKRAPLLKTHASTISRILAIACERGAISLGDLASLTAARTGNTRWGPKTQSAMLINLLWETGYLLVHERSKRSASYSAVPARYWHDPLSRSPAALRRERARRYLEGCGLTDSRDPFFAFERLPVLDRRRLILALIDEGAARLVVLPDGRQLIAAASFLSAPIRDHSTTPCLLAPLENLIWHRLLVNDFWRLHYRWEIYTPPNKRRFGAFAMPLLTSNYELLGPFDARVERESATLAVRLGESVLSPPQADALECAATRLARSLNLADCKLV